MKPHSFTKSSQDIIVKNKFLIVNKLKHLSSNYMEGKLYAALLDIMLIQESEGKYNLRTLMLEMLEKYHTGRPFNNEKLIEKNEKAQGRILSLDLDNHVNGRVELSLISIFSSTGLTY